MYQEIVQLSMTTLKIPYTIPLLTRMYMLDVPDQDTVKHRVEHHHQSDHEEIELVALRGWDVHVAPLDPSAHLLIEGKVLGPETKSSGGEERLDRTEQENMFSFLSQRVKD